ncbi:MAG: adenine deaminase [Candidatus Heimdallarchaeaceae archaeon]
MDTLEIIKSAMAEKKADLILENCKIINVLTREVLEGNIVLKGKRIVHIGENTSEFLGESTRIIDVENSYVCPGLIDSHIHVESSMLTLTEFTKTVIPHGTTTCVIDPHELANVTGIDGLNVLIKEAKTSPIRFLIEAPSCVPSLPNFEISGAIIDSSKIDKLMDNEDIFGLAEMMNYPGVFLGDSEVVKKLNAAKKRGKIIEGHAPLLSGKELQAYIAAGIVSDHETSSWKEALEKLRLGMRVQIREGSFAKDIEKILPGLKDSKIDTRNIIVASDDRNPIDLAEKGHLDYTYRKMIELGVDPLEAIQMMTINTATHLGLHNELGSIAPGKIADLVVFDDLKNFKVSIVIAQGKVLFKEGKLMEITRPFTYPNFILDTLSKLDIPRISDIEIKVPKERNTVKVNVIGVKEHSLITEKLIYELDVNNGVVLPDISNDVLPLIVVNRHTKEKRIGKGFIHGLGLSSGSIASTVAHDSHQLICAGTDYTLMLEAIKTLKECKGGQVVITEEEKTILPLEFAGIMSTLPLNEVVEKTKSLHTKVREIGAKLADPFMALAFVALPVIPHIKLTDHGLIDVDEFKFIEVVTRNSS